MRMPTDTTLTFTIRRANPTDRESVEELLTAADLPIDGVADALGDFFVADANAAIVGVVGMEYIGAYGLLRSTAVDPAWRGRGVARQLVDRIIAEAESRGTRGLYLLTTTAEEYFPAFGFKVTTRDRVPDEVRATSEFRTVCCASATVMALSLAPASPKS